MAHSEHPLHWVRKVDTALMECDLIPLYGNAPRLDFQRISSAIASHFGTSGLSFELHECAWKEAKTLNEGFGSEPLVLSFHLSPLHGDAFWIMSRQDVATLTSWLMNGKPRGRSVSSEILQEGFYRYLALNALEALQGIEPLKDFTIKLSEEASLPFEASWCANIQIAFEENSCWGRFVASNHFLTSWQRHFSSMRELFSLSSIAGSLEIKASLQTGSCLLSQKEWNSLKPGDFILLDRGGYDPQHRKGAAIFMLGTTPLFQISIQGNKVKLLDYALLYEDTMDHKESTAEDSANRVQIDADSVVSSDEEISVKAKELPLLMHVELAKLRMTLDQLMKLSPGNFLELPIHPEQSVALTVNGQKVGRGELVYLGEKLGIRILELA